MRTSQLTLIASAIALLGGLVAPAQATPSSTSGMTMPTSEAARLASTPETHWIQLAAKGQGPNDGRLPGEEDAPDTDEDHHVPAPQSLAAKGQGPNDGRLPGEEDAPDTDEDHHAPAPQSLAAKGQGPNDGRLPGEEDAPDTDEDYHNMPSMLLAKNGADDAEDLFDDNGDDGAGHTHGVTKPMQLAASGPGKNGDGLEDDQRGGHDAEPEPNDQCDPTEDDPTHNDCPPV